jgi:hypothetical protein
MLLNRHVCRRQSPAVGVPDADCGRVAEAPRLVGRHAEGVVGLPHHGSARIVMDDNRPRRGGGWR